LRAGATIHPKPAFLTPAPCTLHHTGTSILTLNPTPYTLYVRGGGGAPFACPPPSSSHSPYTLHPTPHTPHPTPYTLHPTPYALHPTPHILHPAPCTLRPTTPLSSLHSSPSHPCTLHPLTPPPCIPHQHRNPKPRTPNKVCSCTGVPRS
jgi:hypothetical protein